MLKDRDHALSQKLEELKKIILDETPAWQLSQIDEGEGISTLTLTRRGKGAGLDSLPTVSYREMQGRETLPGSESVNLSGREIRGDFARQVVSILRERMESRKADPRKLLPLFEEHLYLSPMAVADSGWRFRAARRLQGLSVTGLAQKASEWPKLKNLEGNTSIRKEDIMMLETAPGSCEGWLFSAASWALDKSTAEILEMEDSHFEAETTDDECL